MILCSAPPPTVEYVVRAFYLPPAMSCASVMDLTQFLALLKQYGPLTAVLIFLLYWFTRRIDELLDRNAKIYEGHIQHLWETQQRLLERLLGAQASSQAAPTVDDLKKEALAKASASKSLDDGGKS